MHFVHYVTRRVTVSHHTSANKPWFAKRQQQEAGFQRPEFHVTRAEAGAAALAGRGDTIWLFSQLRSPWGSLPPALDARIEIAGVKGRTGGGREFLAGRRSRWFPLADASVLLENLRTASKSGGTRRLWSDPDLPVGHALQSMRLLSGEHQLLDWQRKLDERPLQFVSYRLKDGTRSAFAHIQNLIAGRAAAIFWDRWCLPRRLAERREIVADAALDAYLLRVLAKSERVWGIQSPLYDAPGSYSSRERKLAHSLGTFRFARL